MIDPENDEIGRLRALRVRLEARLPGSRESLGAVLALLELEEFYARLEPWEMQGRAYKRDAERLFAAIELVHRKFWQTYEALSEDGCCDSPGATEYRRVLVEWIEAGEPEPCSQFIRRRANVWPARQRDGTVVLEEPRGRFAH